MWFRLTLRIGLIIAAVCGLGGLADAQLTSAFSYRSIFRISGVPVNGAYDLEFRLFDASTNGNQVGNTLTSLNQTIVAGGLAYDLDFGIASFIERDLWLELSYRTAGGGSYTSTTRVKLVPTPFALFSKRAPWSGVLDKPAGFADGVDDIGLAGTGLSLTGSTFSLNLSFADTRYVNEAQANSVTWAMIADGAITSQKIYNGTITGAKIANGHITTTKIADGAITNGKLGAGSVSGDKLAFPFSAIGSSSFPDPLFLVTNSSNGVALKGVSTGGYGVYGMGLTGLYGSGTIYGISGTAPSGHGVFGSGITGVWGDGQIGIAATGTTKAISAQNATNGTSAEICYTWNGGDYGMWAMSNSTTVNAAGFVGLVNHLGMDASASGVLGMVPVNVSAGAGLRGLHYGSGMGLFAQSTMGISGRFANASANNTNPTVYVTSASTESGAHAFVSELTSTANTTATAAIVGRNLDATAGVSVGAGVLGTHAGRGRGVEGASVEGVGVYGSTVSGLAGYFSGDVTVTGSLAKGGGSFKIDHPLDPTNKYLYHSFVESPDMMNVYNGNVTTDVSGMAVVTLPDWFQALNRDFRYQLTVIGQFAQAIVAREIANNRFTIRTDKPNVKVSWQVTGIRHDPWANVHRIPVEVEKSADERGRFLHPLEHGRPREDGIGSLPPSQTSANR